MNKPADRCPGVFRTHPADDGRLARIRLSGGQVEPAALEALALAAEEFGDGHIEITVRANLQVRGIADDRVDAFADRILAAGLATDRAHDRVRNIVVSPLSGRIGGLADVRPAARELEAELHRHQWTRDLSGRFWFGFDDGRGDVTVRDVDVLGAAVSPDEAAIHLGGVPTGRVVPLPELPAAMVAAAASFHEHRADEWRIRELDDRARAAVSDAVAGFGRLAPTEAAASANGGRPDVREPIVGWFEQSDGRVLLGAVTEFGRLSARQAQFAAAIGTPILITPEREILIPDLTEAVAETVVRVLAPLGFIFDSASPWTRFSACTGSPGCGRSHADVRGDLLAHLGAPDAAPGREREHWLGCDRGCGSPNGPHVRRIATGDGYRTDRRVPGG
ncbi:MULTISPECIES: precorrin-3B synthase [Gordonia]|uniref:Precorrin-3B synthase n=1 Tax=Gordonia cholesterolivorans TaxID=559625 RepID=A0ABN3HZ16_9ACTN|nr:MULTISPECIES: precorrin-3B synthase [Gordonia]KJR09290.1 precorrin-3B synthase [Gordonia sihwensis]KXT56037.1 precorrin-3B synthase [Gordonia sp. QH-12]